MRTTEIYRRQPITTEIYWSLIYIQNFFSVNIINVRVKIERASQRMNMQEEEEEEEEVLRLKRQRVTINKIKKNERKKAKRQRNYEKVVCIPAGIINLSPGACAWEWMSVEYNIWMRYIKRWILVWIFRIRNKNRKSEQRKEKNTHSLCGHNSFDRNQEKNKKKKTR